MINKAQDADRCVIRHSRGYLNIDGDHIHFTADGNWGNIANDLHPVNENSSWTALEGLARERTRIIGIVLGFISIVLYAAAAYMYSLLGLFLAVATTYLCWAALRRQEISGLSVRKSSVRIISIEDDRITLSFSTEREGPLKVVLRKVKAEATDRLKKTLDC